MIVQLIKGIDKWIEDGKEEAENYRIKFEEDGKKLNLSTRGFFDEIVFPIINWIMAKAKPG
ncbi:MAG: hypothetical protein KAQ87_01780 [Candidatus Pacebacteria bacterium]|nr:hypothetical protein [Candidatus Paceibacterota bacterium]